MNLRPWAFGLAWLGGLIALVGCALLIGGGPLETDHFVGGAVFSAIATGVGFSRQLLERSLRQRLLMLLGVSVAAGVVGATTMMIIGVHTFDVPFPRLIGLAVSALGTVVHESIMYQRS